MDRHVHQDLTRQWALAEGFDADAAAAVADADWAVDRIHSVREWRNKGYHFAWLGARSRARRLFAAAVTDRDLTALGEALHCIQDAIGHGVVGHVHHWDGIDRWERRSPRVQAKLETESRALLRRYRDATGGGLVP